MRVSHALGIWKVMTKSMRCYYEEQELDREWEKKPKVVFFICIYFLFLFFFQINWEVQTTNHESECERKMMSSKNKIITTKQM